MVDPNDENVTLLIEQAKNGCQQSTNQLFQMFENYLLVISNCELDQRLRTKLGHSDVVQQALSKASAALADFRGTSSEEFKGWLRSIVINEIQQIRRSFGRARRDAALERNLDGDSQVVGYAESLRNPDLTPRSDFIRNEQIEIVRRAVERLSEIEQQVIKLRNWERCSFAEIGEQVEKSEEAVKKIWQRAIKKLDGLMQSDDDE